MKVLLSKIWWDEFELKKELAEYICNHPDEFEGFAEDLECLSCRYDHNACVDCLTGTCPNHYSWNSELRTNKNIIELCESKNFPEYTIINIPDDVTDWVLETINNDMGETYERIIYVVDGKLNWAYAE